MSDRTRQNPIRVTIADGTAAVRYALVDVDDQDPVLEFPVDSWAAFIADVVAGKFDRPPNGNHP